jgi:hypothetical protein
MTSNVMGIVRREKNILIQDLLKNYYILKMRFRVLHVVWVILELKVLLGEGNRNVRPS